jgi:hypothetical protein
MENRNDMQMKNYPTAEQLYAVELAARRQRSEEMGRLIAAAARSIKSGVLRLVSNNGSTGGVRHA